MPADAAAVVQRTGSRADRLQAAAEAVERTVDRLAAPVPATVLRLRQAAVCLLLVVLAFSSSPGAVSGDTKLDLTADPGGWLRDALRVWSPDALGSLQNQAYGYLFPIGPFHAAGLAAGLPAWVVQRLWWSVLLVAAFLGVVRLAARLGLGTPGGRVLAGLAYALSPRVLTELGGLSSELMPLAALPWMLLPLVGADAEQRPRLAAARSGVAVLCAGAVNAAATLAVLPLIGLWLLAGIGRPGGQRLLAWEAVAVGLACAWWVGPLLLQGAYSAPFLDAIETAATTTLTTSPVEVLRGTSHWLAYLAVDGLPWWRAGWTLVTAPVVVLDTAVLAALGLAGLAHRQMPYRGRLGAAALLGLTVMAVGHVGDLTSPLAEQVRALLDGPLAPFRNVHKADPLLRLPLVLGLCHLLTVLPVPPARRALGVLAAIALLGTATPAVAGQLAPAGAFREIPPYWEQAAAWVDEHEGAGSTLLAPAAGDAEHLWGRPLDDPLQVLAERPVVVRDAVPLGGPEVTRLLDAVGARLDTGQGSPGLAPVLSRAGIGLVVVRNDLDRRRTTAPRPALVAQALEDSPGLRRVARFGPSVGSDDRAAREDGLVEDRGLGRPRPAIEVYEVAGDASPVTAYPRERAWRVAGGPDALLQLADRGLLTPDRATVLVGDGDAGQAPRTAITDSLRRRTVETGRVREGGSVTLTAAQPTDGEPVLLPGGAEDRLVTAEWVGVQDVTASSSAADPGAVLARRADRAPAAAFDGDPRTAWLSGSLAGAEGQWLEVELEEPTDLDGATVALAGPATSPAVARSTQVEVRTDTGTLTTALERGESPQPLRVPPGETRTIRVTVTAAEGDLGARLAGIRELALPGVDVARTLVLPPTDGGPDTVVLLERASGARAGCLPTRVAVRCSPALPRPGEEPGPLDRTFVTPADAPLQVTGSAQALPGPALDALLDAGAPVRVRTSSRAVLDPRGRPGTVVDGSMRTGWVAAEDDDAPELELRWDGPRPVTGLELQSADGLVAARPLRVAVTAGGPEVERTVPRDGRIALPPTTTDRVRVRFLQVEELVDVGDTGRLSAVPVGLSELVVRGPQDLTAVEQPDDAPVSLPCGAGPRVALDGEPVPTRVLGTRGDLLALRPLLLETCPPPGAELAAGEHRLVTGPGGGLRVASLTVGPRLPQPPAEPRATEVLRWEPEQRTVAVAPGEASWLVVKENRNAGWQATLDGTVLEPARIDGWQQAWELPAGAGGVVELVYEPGGVQRAWLAGGALAALLLLGLAVGRRPAAGVPAPVRLEPASLAEPNDGDASARRRAGRTRQVVGAVAPALLLTLLGGPAGLLVWAGVALIGRYRPTALPALAAGAMVAAGAVVALSPWSSPGPAGAFSPVAQVLALVATAALAVAVGRISRPAPSTARPQAPPDAPPGPPGARPRAASGAAPAARPAAG